MPATPPEMAAVDFDPKKFMRAKIEALKPRKAVLIAKARSPDRSGIATGVAGSRWIRPTMAPVDRGPQQTQQSCKIKMGLGMGHKAKPPNATSD